MKGFWVDPLATDDGNQRGVLQRELPDIAEPRQREPCHLRHHDPAKQQKPAHAAGFRRLDLTFRHSQDSPPDHLGRISAGDGAERNGTDGEGVDLDIFLVAEHPGHGHGRHAAAEEQQIDDQQIGHTPDQRRVGLTDEAQEHVAGEFERRAHGADDNTEQKCRHGHRERHQHAAHHFVAPAGIAPLQQ